MSCNTRPLCCTGRSPLFSVGRACSQKLVHLYQRNILSWNLRDTPRCPAGNGPARLTGRRIPHLVFLGLQLRICPGNSRWVLRKSQAELLRCPLRAPPLGDHGHCSASHAEGECPFSSLQEPSRWTQNTCPSHALLPNSSLWSFTNSLSPWNSWS